VTQVVPEPELFAEAGRIRRHEVQMVRAPARMRFAEPVHLVGTVRRVQIAELRERREAGARALQVGHADQDVDHRLGVEPGHGRAPHMVMTTYSY
jgi:hypothetical protein